MKPGHVLFSAVQFLFAVFVMLLGGAFVRLHYAAHLRMGISRFFSETTIPFLLIGFIIFACGVLLLLGFYRMNRGVYYRIKMGRREHAIDPAVLHSYVDNYWKEVFPHCAFSTAVHISHGQKIEIYVEIPLSLNIDHKAVMEEAESKLSHILSKYIGHNKTFTLSVLMK
jgi:hypothetical protein